MPRHKDNISRIEFIAEGLKDLGQEVIFIGGACVQFYVPKPELMDFRSTEDVDCIVKITTSVEYAKLSERLRRLGFVNDMSGGPVVRWIYNGMKVDVIPDACEIVGYRKIPWFREGRKSALEMKLPSGRTISILPIALYLATKLEASKDRGGRDYLNDHDMEDIITIIDGIEDVAEIESAPMFVKDFIQKEIKRLLADRDFLSSISGHLGFDATAATRARDVQSKLGILANGLT
jgi:hypothetical protein